MAPAHQSSYLAGTSLVNPCAALYIYAGSFQPRDHLMKDLKELQEINGQKFEMELHYSAL